MTEAKIKMKSKVPFVSYNEDGIVVKIGNSKTTLTVDQYCTLVDQLRKNGESFIKESEKNKKMQKMISL